MSVGLKGSEVQYMQLTCCHSFGDVICALLVLGYRLSVICFY